MAKADKIEVTVFPPEAFVLFAAVAMHAHIASGKNWSAKSLALQSFDEAEAMRDEARKRGFIK